MLLRDDESCEVAEQAVSFTSRDTNDATLITRIRYQLEHALARLTLETGDALDASERCKRTVLRELGKKVAAPSRGKLIRSAKQIYTCMEEELRANVHTVKLTNI